LAETLEECEFLAKVNCLMDFSINLLRMDKRIFLWEFVSNVVDALEKAGVKEYLEDSGV